MNGRFSLTQLMVPRRSLRSLGRLNSTKFSISFAAPALRSLGRINILKHHNSQWESQYKPFYQSQDENFSIFFWCLFESCERVHVSRLFNVFWYAAELWSLLHSNQWHVRKYLMNREKLNYLIFSKVLHIFDVNNANFSKFYILKFIK